MLNAISLYQQENPYADVSRSKMGEQLAKLQQALLKQPKNVLILIEGWESSGKGLVLNDIVRELDPRYYEVHQFNEATDEEAAHPFLWRFYRRLPPYGHIAIFNHGFYSDVLANPVLPKKIRKHQLADIEYFENILIKDGTLLIKFFLHQSKETMQKRIELLQQSEDRDFLVGANDLHQLKHYEYYACHFQEYLAKTHSEESPWHIISTEDRKGASRLVLGTILEKIRAHLDTPLEEGCPSFSPAKEKPLDQLDLNLTISSKDYDKKLRTLQEEAGQLIYTLYKRGIPSIVVFEGTDAAGKGGSIRRLTRLMDPRGSRISTTAAPNWQENRYHYLWRFYREFPKKGNLTIFDRSWYGRVLVERVEKLTPEMRWMAAYDEINWMEKTLTDEGLLLVKFLLVIDKKEQRKRFEDRAKDPNKAYKLTEEDWRNHEKFDLYQDAMNDMVTRTSTPYAPWTVLPSQDKRYARIQVLETFIRAAHAIL